jgi:hypothetical protein
MYKIQLDNSIIGIDIYSQALFILNEFYKKRSDYNDYINPDLFLKDNYLWSMFDTLSNLLDSVGIVLDTDDTLSIVNIIYRLKGLRESIEYLLGEVIKCDFVLDYDYITFDFNITLSSLRNSSIQKFNIYFEKLINELYYTKSFNSEITNFNLVINILTAGSCGISQTYFNDFYIQPS